MSFAQVWFSWLRSVGHGRFHLRQRNLRIDKPTDFVMDHQSGGFKTPVKTSQDMAEAMQ